MLRDRSVLAVLFASFFHAAAAGLQLVALGIQVYDMTKRELDLGLLGLAEFLPAFLLVLITGSVADRFDRRVVGAVAVAVEVLVSIALAVYAASDPTSVGPIFALVLVFGAARGFAAPATRALPPMVAAPAMLPRLVAFSSSTWQAAIIGGPVLGGLLAGVSPAAAYLTAAALLACSVVALTLVRFRSPPERGERPSLQLALEGLRFVRRTPILLAAIALDLFAVLFGGAVALLPAIGKDQLGVSEFWVGALRAAGGIGAVLTAMALAVRPVRRRVGRVLLGAVAVFGLGTILFGVTRSYPVAFLAMMILSGADMISVFIRGTIVPLATPNLMRGRVLAVEAVFIGASNELGAFESGVAGELLGAPLAVVVGGVATLVIVVIWWFGFPALRDLDSFSQLE
jgi:predicted MFS family arabinose efflux permease